MISLICHLDGSTETIDAALIEAKCFANLCVLSEKRCLHIQLLAEELLGMASGLRNGAFWIHEENGHYTLHLSAPADADAKAHSRFSTTGRGISDKVRQAMDWLLTPHSAGATAPAGVYSGMMLALDPPNTEWSLDCYRGSVSRSERDELERSVLGRLADDVRVGVTLNRAEIVIEKTFQ